MGLSVQPCLVSLDVGGTLGSTDEPTITSLLAAASPLDTATVGRVVRDTLHVATQMTEALIEQICGALFIDPTWFPRDHVPAPLHLYPTALPAVRALSEWLPVVTLSNVTCLDADTPSLRAALGSYVQAHYPSCKLGFAKPDPRAFEAVASRHGTSTAAMIHVGDHWECDILGAIGTGATAVWISGGRTVPDLCVSAAERAVVADDLLAAVEHIRGLARHLDGAGADIHPPRAGNQV